MRARILAAILLLALVPTALAVNVQLAWDPKPAGDSRTKVRIYERTGAAAPYTYTLAGEVSEPQSTITLQNIPAGPHTYVARGFNGQIEGPDSNAVSTVVLATPGAVTSVTITIVP